MNVILSLIISMWHNYILDPYGKRVITALCWC
jgi:hypothetical protein